MKLKKQSNFKAHGKYTQLNVYLLSQLILIDKNNLKKTFFKLLNGEKSKKKARN